MSESGVLCGGCWLVDINKVIDHWPAEEGVASICEESMQSGGPGMNLAVNLKRLGAQYPVVGVGLVGDDAQGTFILERCKRYGIDASHIGVQQGARTSYTDALINRLNGKRTFFHSQGANRLLTPEHFNFTDLDVRLFHLGAPGLHDGMDAPCGGEANGWAYLFKKARAAGFRTNLELVSVRAELLVELARPCLPHLDFMIVNDVEAGAVAGVPTMQGAETDLDGVQEAAANLLKRGVHEMVAIHFPKGCVIARPGYEPLVIFSINIPREKIICSVGAGDAFASGLLFGILEGMDLEQAARLGHAAAAVNLGSMSTNECLPAADQCLEQAGKWGWREGM